MSLKSIARACDNRARLWQLADTVNILPKDSGLPYKVRVSSKSPVRKPRIRVYTGNGFETISVSIEDKPLQVAGKKNAIQQKELEQVYGWIILNKEALLNYWNDAEADAVELIRSLRSL